MPPLFRRADRTRRHLGAALLAGLVAGVLSGFVKLGWEGLLPPRTPDRDLPPLVLLQHFGVNTDSLTFSYSGQEVNWSSLAVHFGFSVVVVVFYCLVAEFLPGVTLWLGVAYGLGVWVVFHLVVLPALGLTPATWQLPFQENLSEALGHAVWLVAAELVRRAVRELMCGASSVESVETSSGPGSR